MKNGSDNSEKSENTGDKGDHTKERQEMYYVRAVNGLSHG